MTTERAWDFSIDLDHAGLVMFEHWAEPDSDHPTCLRVSSIPEGMVLKPGDVIVKRIWVPTSTPKIFNWARR